MLFATIAIIMIWSVCSRVLNNCKMFKSWSFYFFANKNQNVILTFQKYNLQFYLVGPRKD